MWLHAAEAFTGTENENDNATITANAVIFLNEFFMFFKTQPPFRENYTLNGIISQLVNALEL